MKKRSPITTHVLDLTAGVAAKGVPVLLEKRVRGRWMTIGKSKTNADGRVEDLLGVGEKLVQTDYRLTFDIEAYRGKKGRDGFYPEAVVTFRIRDLKRHHHIPLLLSDFGYSTYRGT